MLKLIPRPSPSRVWTLASPLLALAITVIVGLAIFSALGKNPLQGLLVFFWEPIKSPYALGELMVKATPLLIIALGLSVCFRSNVWNIGAEGQFVMGAIFAGGMALSVGKAGSADAGFGNALGVGIIPAILLAGLLGGMFWAGIMGAPPDWLRAGSASAPFHSYATVPSGCLNQPGSL